MFTQQPIRRTASRPGGLSLLAGRSVLCVLPNARLASVVRDALAPAALVFASDGGEALAAIYRGPFDAYVIDYWLPDWTGVSLCREIRKSDPHVPVCFFTNAHRADAMRRALRAGADVYLDATADARRLRNRVESLLLAREAQLLQARIEEERAIEEELARRARALSGAAVDARQRAAAAIARSARAKAWHAFVSAGGTRARFEQAWADTYADVAARSG